MTEKTAFIKRFFMLFKASLLARGQYIYTFCKKPQENVDTLKYSWQISSVLGAAGLTF